MEAYLYEEDGKLHTRYSELKKCIPSGINDVIETRMTGIRKSNEYMEFGILRHEKFAEYIKAKNALPSQFGVEVTEIIGCERSYAIEVFENVVIHFTPDVFGHDWVGDLKTTSNPQNYKYDKQLDFYAWLLNHHKDINIDLKHYFCEIWDKERENLKGYETLTKAITNEDIQKIEAWTVKRVEFLVEALKERYERFTATKNS